MEFRELGGKVGKSLALMWSWKLWSWMIFLGVKVHIYKIKEIPSHLLSLNQRRRAEPESETEKEWPERSKETQEKCFIVTAQGRDLLCTSSPSLQNTIEFWSMNSKPWALYLANVAGLLLSPILYFTLYHALCHVVPWFHWRWHKLPVLLILGMSIWVALANKMWLEIIGW